MNSLYDELSEKLKRESGTARRAGARADIGILLFSHRDALHDLWIAAEKECAVHGATSAQQLHTAVERLRPLFGERPGP